MFEGLILMTLGFGCFSAWAVHEAGKLLRRRAAEIEACGFKMERVPAAWSRRGGMTASDGVVRLLWEEGRHNRGGNSRLTLEIPGLPGFDEVTVRHETEVLKKLREIELGAPEFDSLFFVRGPVRLVSALFDAETRRLITDIFNETRYLEIQGGRLQVGMMSSQLELLLPMARELGNRFAQTVEIRKKLAENARQDPEPGARLRNLLLLVREQPDAPDSREALRQACSDPDPEVRLGAALALGAQGRETLLQLAETRGDDALSAQAIRHLGKSLPFERAYDLLRVSLRWRRRQTAHACLDALAASGAAEAVEALVSVLDREKGELAAAAAQALGATGHPAAEPGLIRALQREEDGVQIAAAQALGHVGTAGAVLPLKEAQEASRSADLRRAARQAVAQIQSRLPGASAGQLSLAGTEAGRLSIAEGEAGQLSIVDSKDPRVV